MTRATLSILASGLCAMAVACGAGTNAGINPTSTDIISRSKAIQTISEAACERADDCGNIGSNGKWTTKQGCLNDQEGVFEGKWSTESCADPHGVIEGKLADCMDRVKQYQCSGNLFDLGGVLTECGEKDVCR